MRSGKSSSRCCRCPSGWAGRRNTDGGRSLTRSCTSCVPAARGGTGQADFPPWQTVYAHFNRFNERGVTERILDELREQVRIAQGREPEPTAAIIDSQSVKGADTVGRGSRGYDAGKKVNGRKRFIVTDTLGLLIVVCVMAASVQDRDGAKTTLLSMVHAVGVRFVLADGGFAGVLVDWCRRILAITLEIVRKPAGQ